MDNELLEKAIYQGFKIRFSFSNEKPTFGDLFLIRGFAHPQFHSTNHFNFSALEPLDFDQVDDYFGIPAYDEEEGDDVKVWLFPLIGNESIYHHNGPFDALQLSYDALRNPPRNGELLLEVVANFARHLPVEVSYELREQNLGNPPDLAIVHADLEDVVAHWRSQGIEPGSSAALQIDF